MPKCGKPREGIMSKDEVFKKMQNGEIVYNYAWWFQMNQKNGRIFGGCDDPDCCFFEFDNFEEMWRSFDENKWK